MIRRPAIARAAGVCAVAAGLLAGPAAAQRTEDGHPVWAGDPTLAFAGGAYYVFGSGRGAPILRSTDLAVWRPVGRIFPGLPDWVRREIPESDGGCWAPDIACVDGEYRVYWSASSLGSRHSVIGLACNRTLDPGAPGYRWEDRGRVLGTTEADNWNAIDPQCVEDAEGRLWLAMGSYWSGIKLRRLDRKTGMLSADDRELRALAGRPGVNPPSIEGAYIVRRDGWYYLFVSFGSCVRGVHSDYHIRVGRSRAITGPYVDAAGRSMIEGGGTLVLASHGTVCGPGHNSVLLQGDRGWLACHRFDVASGGRRALEVRPLFWDEHGWPVAGEPVTPVSAAAAPAGLAGRWRYGHDFAEPRTITLNADGTVEGPASGATWEAKGDRLVLTWRRDGGDPNRPLVESCFVGGGGAWFVGRNRFGEIVRGLRELP